MNREILFRGKDKEAKKWVYGGYCLINGEPRIVVEVRADITYVMYVSVDPDTVGQFTGFLDKKGKKIFEGDVCLIPDDTDPECPENLLTVVVFNTVDGNWQLQTIPDKYHHSVKEWLCEFGDECEVIGNKWDNPELLEP